MTHVTIDTGAYGEVWTDSRDAASVRWAVEKAREDGALVAIGNPPIYVNPAYVVTIREAGKS